MRRLTNFTGLFLLCYFAYNYKSWHLGIREDNILSYIFVKPIQWVPHWIIYFLIGCIIITYVRTIYNNEKNLALQIITFSLITVVTKICVSIMMLENISYFSLFYIEHPVPMELKYLHFKNSLSSALDLIPKEEMQYMITVLGSNINLQNILEKITLDIKDLNALEITNYVEEFVNNIERNSNEITKKHLFYIALLLTFSSILTYNFL